MRSVKSNFPYPVLAVDSDDYIDCSFDLETTLLGINGNNITLESKYSLSSCLLREAVATGKAVILIRIESPVSFFRTSFLFERDNDTIEYAINGSDIATTLLIKGYVISTEEMLWNSENEHNVEYFSGLRFRIQKGDILAYEPGTRFELDSSEFEKPIKSIISINLGEGITSTQADYSRDIITVFLNEKAFDEYKRLRARSEMRRYLSGIVVYPVVVEAIRLVISETEYHDTESYTSLKWKSVIRKKLIEKGFRFEEETNISPLTAADTILGNIAEDSITNLHELFEKEFDASVEQIGGIS